MTVADPFVPEVPRAVPSYSTVQIGASLLALGVESMTIPTEPAPPPRPLVLQFQLPSEPAELQKLMQFAPVPLRIIDIGPLTPRLD